MEVEEETQVTTLSPAPAEEKQKPEQKYYTGYVPYGVTSFAELDEMEQAQEAASELNALTWSFLALVENIIWDDTIADKAVAITNVASELIVRVNQTLSYAKSASISAEQVKEFSETAPLALKESNFAIRKGLDGKWYAYGKPTNNFLDRDGEILTEDAHKEFVGYLQTHPDQMPELWDWHDEDFKCANRACWVDYADNSLHMVWELTEEESKRYSKAAEEYDLAMSHGFYPLQRDAKYIKQYRMVEASVLPREFCANTLTDFSVEESESKMAFTPDKRKFLVAMHGEEYVARLETENEKQAAKNRSEVEHKATKDETPAPAFDAEAAFNQLNEGVNVLATAMTQILQQGTATPQSSDSTPASEGESPADSGAEAPEPEAAKAAATPSPTPMMSLLAALKSYDPVEGASVEPIKGTSKLAKSKPAETKDEGENDASLVGFSNLLKNAEKHRQSDADGDDDNEEE